MKPRIFLSAVTSELGQSRQLAANILLRLGYDPVWQDIFGTEGGDLRQMLREKIDDCDGLVHLVGFAYGFEPPSPDPEFGRVSYTQYEWLYAQKTGKRTWVLFVEDGFPTDRRIDQLDLPPGKDQPDAGAWQTERRALQEKWRSRLRGESHLWHAAKSRSEFELKLERLKDEFQDLRQSFASWQKAVSRNLVAAMVLIVVLGIGIAWALWHQPDVKEVIEDSIEEKTIHIAQAVVAEQMNDIKPDLIKAQFCKQVEATYQQELAEAEKLTDWKAREAAKKAAAEARERTLRQIDAFVESISNTVHSGDATSEFMELTRILQEQGVEEASAFVTREESRLLKEIENVPLDQKQELRRKLMPLQEGISLLRSRGRFTEAVALCDKLLELDPAWPELVETHVQIHREQGEHAEQYTTLAAAKEHYDAALVSAKRQAESQATKKQGHVNLSILYERLGDVARLQGQMSEAEKLFLESIRQSQMVIEVDPQERTWLRNQSSTYGRLSQMAVQRANYDEAIQYAEQALTIADKLVAADNNPAWRRTLSIALDQIGNLKLDLGQYDEAESHYRRSLEIREQAVAEFPGIINHQQDLMVSYDLMGGVHRARGQWPQAMQFFEKERALAEAVVKTDPDRASLQYSLALALQQIGSVQRKQGESDGAAQTYQQAIEITKRLFESDQQNTVWQDDLAGMYDELGQIAMAKGELAQAEGYFKQTLEFRKKLVTVDPANRVWQRNLGISYRLLGGLKNQQGETDEAVRYHQEALAVRRELYQANRESALWRNDLRMTLNELGDLATKQRREAIAESYYSECRELCQLFVDAHPQDASWQHELGWVLLNLGIVNTGQEKFAESVKWYRQALDVRRRLAQKDSKNAEWRRDEWIAEWFLAEDLEAMQSPMAKEHWEAAHDRIASMIADGFPLSEGDQQTFARIKSKAGK